MMLHRRRADDEGSTLVVAMMVMGVALSLSLLVTTVAITGGRTTGQDRARLVAVNAAESAVDSAYAAIQTGGLSLPCSWPTAGGVETIPAIPANATTSATIRYNSPSYTNVCSTGLNGETPTQAIIEATASAQGITRKVEALVDLTPVRDIGLTKALFGEALVNLSNNASVTSETAESPDVYSNGNFVCGNSPVFGGRIYAPFGSVTMNNTCTAQKDVWARDAVVLSGNKTLGGNVWSGSSSVTADNNTNIVGSVKAKTTISWSGCGPAQCTPGSGSVGLPKAETFPRILGTAAAFNEWTSPAPSSGLTGPYTIVAIPAGTCGSAAGDWLKSKVATITQNTLYTTDCAVEFSNTKSTPFNRDVALFARGGVSTSNQVSIESTSSATRNIAFIHPYDAAASLPCTTTPVMGPSQQFSSATEVNLLWYSPCNVSYGNQGGSYGQVYSGSTLTTNNQYTLVYRKVPVVGFDLSTAPTISYDLTVVYKREAS